MSVPLSKSRSPLLLARTPGFKKVRFHAAKASVSIDVEMTPAVGTVDGRIFSSCDSQDGCLHGLCWQEKEEWFWERVWPIDHPICGVQAP